MRLAGPLKMLVPANAGFRRKAYHPGAQLHFQSKARRIAFANRHADFFHGQFQHGAISRFPGHVVERVLVGARSCPGLQFDLRTRLRAGFQHPPGKGCLDVDLVDRLIRQHAGHFRLLGRQAMQRAVTGAKGATRDQADKDRERGNDRIADNTDRPHGQWRNGP